MQTFAQYALPAMILVSAIGAVALCAVLVFYGFRRDDEEGPSPARRLFAMRLGHAIAAACFAAALMLGGVALVEQRRMPAPVASAMAAQPSDEVQRLEARVQSLEARLAATELRLGDAVQQVSAVEARVATIPPTSRPAKRATRPAKVTAVKNGWNGAAPTAGQREPGEAMTARPAASQPIVLSASTSASDDQRPKFRERWHAVKRWTRETSEDVGSGFTAFGRRVKKVFD